MPASRSNDPRVTAGVVALAAISLLIGGALAGLAFEGASDPSGAVSAFDGYLFRVVRFTLWQAALSTLLSVAPALLVARALSRHPRFPGRRLILQLFAVPLALALVAADAAGFSLAATAVAVLAAAYLPECALAWTKGWYMSPRMVAAMMARDLLLPAIWARGWLGGAVDWRGNAMTIRTKAMTELEEGA